MNAQELFSQVSQSFDEKTHHCSLEFNQCQVELPPTSLLDTACSLRDEFSFEQLMDITVVDLLEYGKTEWKTAGATSSGFSRAVNSSEHARKVFTAKKKSSAESSARFVVIYNLLSISTNTRIRLKVAVENAKVLVVPSVVDIWACANWFEREAFDFFGVHFSNHPDMRRILTDYGFSGHPFRKDFPLSGEYEVRYDPSMKKVIQQPVSIEPRVLVPKVIRKE